MKLLVAGMGLMGSALAHALISRGHDVTVWNRTPDKCRPAADAGAYVAGSLTDGIERSEIVIVCMFDYGAAASALLNGGALDACRGKSLVQLSQATPDESRELASTAAAGKVGYLEGSILGYPHDVRAGTCTIVYAGRNDVFRHCLPALEAFGAAPCLLGEEPGIATVFDKAFFSYYYAHLFGLMHGAAICRAANISLAKYAEIITGIWDWRNVDRTYVDLIATGRTSDGVDAKIDTDHYAMKQVAPLCDALGVDTSLPDAIQGTLEAAMSRGLRDLNLTAVVDILQRIDRR